MSKHNAWRHNLDPRDPDYLEPPTDEEAAEEAEMQEYIAESKAQERDE